MTGWFCNGDAIDRVPVEDRAFQYGDGLFETIAIRNGQPRLWDLHLDRLGRGCETLRLANPDRNLLRNWLDRAIDNGRSAETSATAKIVVSAGSSRRGYARSMPAAATVYVGVFAASPVADECYRNGVDSIVCETRLATFSVTAGCKTLNRIEQVLARSECVAKNAFEGLTLDAAGRLICGTMSNVFLVSDNAIATPSLERCGVEGVMRRHVIAALGRRGQAVAVRDISETELRRADEVFISNSQFGVIPLRSCGARSWEAHPVTRSVMSLMAENQVVECEL